MEGALDETPPSRAGRTAGGAGQGGTHQPAAR